MTGVILSLTTIDAAGAKVSKSLIYEDRCISRRKQSRSYGIINEGNEFI